MAPFSKGTATRRVARLTAERGGAPQNNGSAKRSDVSRGRRLATPGKALAWHGVAMRSNTNLIMIHIELTFLEELLGTKAANPDVFRDFIASKHPSGTPQKDELDSAEHREEAGTTVFSRQDGKVGIFNYQIKGMFKDAAAAVNRFDKEFRNGQEKLSAFKSKIDGVIFVQPRFIPLILPEGQTVGVCERPLRAETAQGPRVSVCRSETAPAGTILRFQVEVLSKDLMPWLHLWLNYGAKRGLGQWRNSGKGAFAWKEIPVKAEA